MSLKLNTILANRYQIREQLSQKAGRQTFLAEDLQSQNLVIIKLLCFDANFRWDDLKLFEREADTLRNLHHLAIPQYLNYFDLREEVDTPGFALVQTYINAPSLENVIKAGRKFSELEVIELADRLLSILTYLHEQIPAVIHRDLKPSNILLTNRSSHSIGDIYLVDFGSVQTVANKDGGTITIVGTYGYIPLEQFGGETTPSSDLYSLGMTLIYLITGVHPSELPKVNGRVQFDTNNLSGRFSRWLEKMTQPYPDHRFESARSAQTALTSPDGSYGDFLHLRPADSQINLHRDRDRLELKFSGRIIKVDTNLSLSLLQLLTTISGWATITLFFCLISCNLWILGCFLISVGLFFILNEITENYHNSIMYFVNGIVSFNRIAKTIEFGTFSQKTGESHWSVLPLNNVPIDLLVYQPSYSFDNYYDIASNETKLGNVNTTPKLSICRGNHQYFISENNLSEAELRWLGQELSDFLDLELQIIYPTPHILAPVVEVVDNDCGCV
jgi:serine/threonine protein kinase